MHKVANQVRRNALLAVPNDHRLVAVDIVLLLVTQARGDKGLMEHSGAVPDINSSIVANCILTIAQGSDARILVVDDDGLTLALISDLLQSRGFEVQQASDGAQAFKLLEREWFPVIITDWQMPVMNGLELARR
jgi:PleD family two-component response regulator